MTPARRRTTTTKPATKARATNKHIIQDCEKPAYYKALGYTEAVQMPMIEDEATRRAKARALALLETLQGRLF